MFRLLARTLALTAVVAALSSCALYRLTAYSLFPDYPDTQAAPEAGLAGLTSPVDVTLLADGSYRIAATRETDMYFAEGYLQARDRMFQMDLLRHMAEGRIAELVGNVPYGDGTALDADVFMRFVGGLDDYAAIANNLPAEERTAILAFTAGINAWIAEGHASIEHRLLGAEVAPWRPEDSLAIFRFVMFGMTHNYSRELRRLLVACDAGLDAAERVWPTKIDYGPTSLPPEAVRAESYPQAPAVVPEMREALAGLCPKQAAPQTALRGAIDVRASLLISEIYLPLTLLETGLTTSNNWVVSGAKTQSGKPLLENDPHLVHIAPPIVWKVHQVLPDRELAGFALPGLHQVIFGHNFHVAWGQTINPVDLQDLYVERLTADGKGYEYEGAIKPLSVKTETFGVRGGDPIQVSVRFTEHGPLLNDVEPFLKDRIPPTALKIVRLSTLNDAPAMRKAIYARSVTGFVDAIQGMDSACINWIAADTAGNIGYTSPCLVPVRKHHWGSFAVPGWLAKYEWAGFVPKAELPRSINPARGWIATANGRVIAFDKFPTAYNNDANPPNRYVRLSAFLSTHDGLTPADMAKLGLDTGLFYWPQVRAAFDATLCRPGAYAEETARDAAAALCAWNGELTGDASASTVWQLMTNALVDRALGDEVSPAVWRYVQSIPHFEANADWAWNRPATDPVWDDVRTPAVESRDDIFAAAFGDAVSLARERYGDDVADWKWGEVRPFYVKHPFGGKGWPLSSLFNSAKLPGTGGPETVFKNQFLRSDRTNMLPNAGPAFRFVIDMADPRAAEYVLAGGESGWAKSPHYEDQLADFMLGTMHPLTPEGGTAVRFMPGR
jgi:penicillin amidase